MPENWADIVADRVAGAKLPAGGMFLFLGAADTGKTTLASALANHLPGSQPVAIADADVGPSHIGPPTTVGWTLLGGTDKVGVAPPQSSGVAMEQIKAPLWLRRKSPETRQEHRSRLFRQYFQNATTHTVDVGALAVRGSCRTIPENTVGRLVGLTDAAGQDVAIGAIERWRHEKATGTIRAPRLDMQDIRCLTIGDVRIDTPFGWS